jgi:hypothetical protein
VSTEEPTAEELRTAALQVMRFVVRKLAEPLAPDHEVREWPLMTDPGVGGVWCADADCPLMAENSEIGDFRDGATFTLNELYEAVAVHISGRRDRENEEADRDMEPPHLRPLRVRKD